MSHSKWSNHHTFDKSLSILFITIIMIAINLYEWQLLRMWSFLLIICLSVCDWPRMAVQYYSNSLIAWLRNRWGSFLYPYYYLNFKNLHNIHVELRSDEPRNQIPPWWPWLTFHYWLLFIDQGFGKGKFPFITNPGDEY